MSEPLMTDTELKELISALDGGDPRAALSAKLKLTHEVGAENLARQLLELRAENERLKAERDARCDALGREIKNLRDEAEAAEARLRGIAEIAREYTANETHYRWLTAVMKRILALATEANNE